MPQPQEPGGLRASAHGRQVNKQEN